MLPWRLTYKERVSQVRLIMKPVVTRDIILGKKGCMLTSCQSSLVAGLILLALLGHLFLQSLNTLQLLLLSAFLSAGQKSSEWTALYKTKNTITTPKAGQTTSLTLLPLTGSQKRQLQMQVLRACVVCSFALYCAWWWWQQHCAELALYLQSSCR